MCTDVIIKNLKTECNFFDIKRESIDEYGTDSGILFSRNGCKVVLCVEIIGYSEIEFSLGVFKELFLLDAVDSEIEFSLGGFKELFLLEDICVVSEIELFDDIDTFLLALLFFK